MIRRDQTNLCDHKKKPTRRSKPLNELNRPTMQTSEQKLTKTAYKDMDIVTSACKNPPVVVPHAIKDEQDSL
jgi:hypothetical protein